MTPETNPTITKTTSINELAISVRAYNGLVNAGCLTVDDVCKLWVTTQFRGIRNFGKQSQREVESLLRSLGMIDDNTPVYVAPTRVAKEIVSAISLANRLDRLAIEITACARSVRQVDAWVASQIAATKAKVIAREVTPPKERKIRAGIVHSQERKIAALRCRVNGELKYEDIGKIFGVCKNRAHQLVLHGRRILAHPSWRDRLECESESVQNAVRNGL